jgi:hypothetical protein
VNSSTTLVDAQAIFHESTSSIINFDNIGELEINFTRSKYCFTFHKKMLSRSYSILFYSWCSAELCEDTISFTPHSFWRSPCWCCWWWAN